MYSVALCLLAQLLMILIESCILVKEIEFPLTRNVMLENKTTQKEITSYVLVI